MSNIKLRNLACLILSSIVGSFASAADVQLTITQSSQVTTTLQPVSAGTFSQISPAPASYAINTEFKFYKSVSVNAFLGTATGLVYEIPGSGCLSADYAAFPSGSIALFEVSSISCSFSTQINAAAAAGAVGTIKPTLAEDLTDLNRSLVDTVTVPSIFISSTLADALLAQLNDTLPPVVSYTVGGSIAGLTGTVTLQNNGGNNLVRSTNGGFTFATALADGSAYAVTVLAQPAGQICTVNNGSGTIATANVVDVAVNCVAGSVPPGPSSGRIAQIPTMSAYGLALTVLGLLLVAGRRIRNTGHRR